MRYELRITGLEGIEPWPDPVEGTPWEIARQSISGLLDTPEVMAVPDSAAVVLVRRLKRGKRVRWVVKGRWTVGDFRAQAAPAPGAGAGTRPASPAPDAWTETEPGPEAVPDLNTAGHAGGGPEPQASPSEITCAGWGVVFRVLYPDATRALTPDERQRLRDSIEAAGEVWDAVIVDDHGGVIAGANRLELAAELGLPLVKVPTKVLSGADHQKGKVNPKATDEDKADPGTPDKGIAPGVLRAIKRVLSAKDFSSVTERLRIADQLLAGQPAAAEVPPDRAAEDDLKRTATPLSQAPKGDAPRNLLGCALTARSEFSAGCALAAVALELEPLEECYGAMGDALDAARGRCGKPTPVKAPPVEAVIDGWGAAWKASAPSREADRQRTLERQAAIRARKQEDPQEAPA